MSLLQKLAALFLVYCFVVHFGVEGLDFGCENCYGETCDDLPTEDCQPGRATCACCDECKKKVGDNCFSLGVDCEDGLTCQYEPAIPDDFYLKFGTCQAVSTVGMRYALMAERRVRNLRRAVERRGFLTK